MKKKGYYFTVDALLAVAVLVLGIILVLFGFASDPVETPQFILADDVLRVLATTEASPGVTYFQQIGEFVAKCEFNNAKVVSEHIISDALIPAQFNFQLVVVDSRCDGETIPDNFAKPILDIKSKNSIVLKEDATVLITTRKIIFDRSVREQFFDPFTVEAVIWR